MGFRFVANAVLHPVLRAAVYGGGEGAEGVLRTLWGADGERSRFALPLWRVVHLAQGERGLILHAPVSRPRNATRSVPTMFSTPPLLSSLAVACLLCVSVPASAQTVPVSFAQRPLTVPGGNEKIGRKELKIQVRLAEVMKRKFETLGKCLHQ